MYGNGNKKKEAEMLRNAISRIEGKCRTESREPFPVERNLLREMRNQATRVENSIPNAPLSQPGADMTNGFTSHGSSGAFSSFNDFVGALVSAGNPAGQTDQRLFAAATGLGETVSSDGGTGATGATGDLVSVEVGSSDDAQIVSAIDGADIVSKTDGERAAHPNVAEQHYRTLRQTRKDMWSSAGILAEHWRSLPIRSHLKDIRTAKAKSSEEHRKRLVNSLNPTVKNRPPGHLTGKDLKKSDKGGPDSLDRKMIPVTIIGSPPAVEIWIDGSQVARQSPLRDFELVEGTRHSLRLHHPSCGACKDLKKDFTVVKSAGRKGMLIRERISIKSAHLKVVSKLDGTVVVNNAEKGSLGCAGQGSFRRLDSPPLYGPGKSLTGTATAGLCPVVFLSECPPNRDQSWKNIVMVRQ